MSFFFAVTSIALTLWICGTLFSIAKATKSELVYRWVIVLLTLVGFEASQFVFLQSATLWKVPTVLSSLVFVVVAPRFFCLLVGREWTSTLAHGSTFGSGLVTALSILALAASDDYLALWLLALIFVATVLFGLVLLFLYFVSHPRTASGRFIGRFLVLGLVFLPLAAIDHGATLGQWTWWMDWDNLTLPVFLVVLDVLIVLESRRWLSPAKVQETEAPAEALDPDLSAKELALIKLILSGASAKEIGGELGITAKTAENYTYRLYRKLGVSNRIQLYNKFRAGPEGI